jgi:hypothetical protein
MAEGQAARQSVRVREFTALCRTGLPPKLVQGSCQIRHTNITPCECVEYAFQEEPDRWRMAQVCGEALEAYRSSKFESWLKMLKEPTCEAQLRRMIEIGPVTHLYDLNLFPTPQDLKSRFQVTNEKTGRMVDIPHPVSRLRLWNCSQQRYEGIDTQLAGAPAEHEKEKWWNNILHQLEGHHGKDYIASLAHGASQMMKKVAERLDGSFTPKGASSGLARKDVTTTLTSPALPGDTTINVASAAGFLIGDEILLGPERKRIVSLNPLHINSQLNASHGIGVQVRKVIPP